MVNSLTLIWQDRKKGIVFKPPLTHSVDNIFNELTDLKPAQASLNQQLAIYLNTLPKHDLLFSRLDYETQGAIAFNNTYKQEADQKNQDRQHFKIYLARVKGLFPNLNQWIQFSSSFESAGKNAQKVKVVLGKKNNSKQLYTTFFQCSFFDPEKKSSLVWALIHQGARHQIRAHLSYLGFPIINDPLYNKNSLIPQKAMQLFSYGVFEKEKNWVLLNPDLFQKNPFTEFQNHED